MPGRRRVTPSTPQATPPSLRGGAARGWCPIRSSKPARRRSPAVGRFDSCAAPLRQNRPSPGSFGRIGVDSDEIAITAQDRSRPLGGRRSFPTVSPHSARGPAVLAIRSLKIRVEEDGSLILGSREEVAVEIERHGDRGVTHESLQRLGVLPGPDRVALRPAGTCRDRARQTNRLTNASALSATSRQPLSIVRECPRLGILTISVTDSLCFCLLYAPLAIAHGTVWSFSPSMISSGPRRGFFGSIFASVRGFTFALAICISATPGAATW